MTRGRGQLFLAAPRNQKIKLLLNIDGAHAIPGEIGWKMDCIIVDGVIADYGGNHQKKE